MRYVDRSVPVKSYVREPLSGLVARPIRAANEFIPRTSLHVIDFTNAVRLKPFRGEMTADQAELVLTRYAQHQEAGVCTRAACNWDDVSAAALNLCRRDSGRLGHRSRDGLPATTAMFTWLFWALVTGR